MSTVRTYETGVDQRFFAQTARRKQCSKYRHDVTERAEPPAAKLLAAMRSSHGEDESNVLASPIGRVAVRARPVLLPSIQNRAVPSWRYQ